MSWTGADASGAVNIIGTSSGTAGDSLGMAFYCRVSGALNQFAVPAEVTRLMPAGAGSLAVNFEKPGAVGGRPASLDAFRYERRVMRSRSVVYR